jgi:hypothetical protein
MINQQIKNPTRAVIVGADAEQAWMLDWWYGNYIKHNKYPIIFADFGLHPSHVEWCKKRGTVLGLRIPSNIRGWFKKPFAIFQSGIDIALWIDVDCEIRANVEPIFNFITYGKVAMAPDKHNRWCVNETPLNSGVIGAWPSSHALIGKWADRCRRPNKRGDQEIFNDMVSEWGDSVLQMPQQFNRLRLDGDSPDALIMHWTGPAGKAHIKKVFGAQEPLKMPKEAPKVISPNPAYLVKPAMTIRKFNTPIGRLK